MTLDKDKNQTESMESLLPRYCDGNVTEEERRRVVEWMNDSAENKRIAKQINLIYLASHAIKVRKDINTDKALQRVTGKMIVHRKRRKYWEWAQRAAAVLFIPLLAATLLLSTRPEAKDGIVAAARLLEISTGPGMTGSFVLPDGTKVYLNSETKLIYPDYFDGATREVTLSGEAYFEVAKDVDHRFVVHTPHQSQIEVLGTSFNVEAYENDEAVTTTLVEGRVNFYYNNVEQSRQLVTLQPNEKLVYQCGNRDIDLRPTSCLAETAWKDGKIVFRNTTLREGLKTLAKRYNVEFIIKNSKGLDDPFTGTFTNQRLERILQYFSISSHIRWRYVDGGDINETKSKIEIY